MDTFITSDWGIRLSDVLGVPRRGCVGRFPQLAPAALETLLERLRDDLPKNFLPTLGRELESLGLMLTGRPNEDDGLNLHMVDASHSWHPLGTLTARGHSVRTLRQEGTPEGARVALLAAAPANLAPVPAHICLEHVEYLTFGLTIARLPDEDSRNLPDLHQWSKL